MISPSQKLHFPPRCPSAARSDIILSLCTTTSRLLIAGPASRCTAAIRPLIVAIATRHADAVDIKFLVDERPVWIALPHVAWVEYNRQTGKVITDPMAVQIAGHYLKWAIESGEDNGREMYTLTVEETLDQLKAVTDEALQPAAR